LIVGNVEHLEKIKLFKKFDIILFTDLMEHLTNPGLALIGIKNFMHNNSELIISAPHSFGIPNYIRYVLGNFKEGNQHVATYNSANIKNLLDRYGFKVAEIYSAFEKEYRGITKVVCSLPIATLKLLPKYGGTLLVVAKLKR